MPKKGFTSRSSRRILLQRVVDIDVVNQLSLQYPINRLDLITHFHLKWPDCVKLNLLCGDPEWSNVAFRVIFLEGAYIHDTSIDMHSVAGCIRPINETDALIQASKISKFHVAEHNQFDSTRDTTVVDMTRLLPVRSASTE